jgi:hypothetical protein
MGKYTITKEFIRQLKSAINPDDLKAVLKTHFEDAFIEWDSIVFNVGDIIRRKSISAELNKPKYLIVKTHDGHAQILSFAKAGPVLWKNTSTDAIDSFGGVTLKMFQEITNGMSHKAFQLESPMKKK